MDGARSKHEGNFKHSCRKKWVEVSQRLRREKNNKLQLGLQLIDFSFLLIPPTKIPTTQSVPILLYVISTVRLYESTEHHLFLSNNSTCRVAVAKHRTKRSYASVDHGGDAFPSLEPKEEEEIEKNNNNALTVYQ